VENLDENRVPKAWVGREVVVKPLGQTENVAGMFGKLEDVHDGGVVLSWKGPTRAEEELGPVLFYPWSAIESLRLRVPPGEQETREEPHDRVGEVKVSFERYDARALLKVVPVAQRRSAAGITVALSALDIYEGGRSLLRYSVSPDPGTEAGPGGGPVRYFVPEVLVRDERGRSYEALQGSVRSSGSTADGELHVVGLPESGTSALEVEVLRLFEEPPVAPRRGEPLAGPWVFKFSL
jgi:hypothetical protein